MKKVEVQQYGDLITSLIDQNGPTSKDYPKLHDWFEEVGTLIDERKFEEEEINYLRECFEDTLTRKTLHGFVYEKPHGYPGDFEVIDKIYTHHVSSEEKFKNWDIWFQNLTAAKAVRNRKDYFKRLLKSKLGNGTVRVLNLASGPCRDLVEFFEENPDADVMIDCIEIDTNAIAFAKKLLGDNISKVNFRQANIFKFSTSKKYDLIWSAGLFDYFEDKAFVGILSRFVDNFNPGGELVIGNFHPSNTARRAMEFGMWHLHHRTEVKLFALAALAGYSNHKIKCDSEAQGVNLFMRITPK